MIRPLLIALAGSCLMAGAVQAQEDYYSGGLFDFEGFYAGVMGGAYVGEDFGWSGGVMAGANFAVNDILLLGLEFQGGALYRDEEWGWDGLVVAHAGAMLTDTVLVYGAAGTGWVDDAFSYAAGGGVEYGFMDQVAVRGEALAVGEWGSGIDSAKATVGLIWHMN